MTKGVKRPTPLAARERIKYKTRRAKNNESAARHRERTRNQIKEGEEYKKKFEELLVDFNEMARRVAEVENEKASLLEFLLTHECVSTTAHREQLYCTFSTTASKAIKAHRHLPSLNKIEHSLGFIEAFEPPRTPLMQHQNERPTEFCMSNYPAVSPPASYSSQDQYQPIYDENTMHGRFATFEEFLASSTGLTPAPGHFSNFCPPSVLDEFFTAPHPHSNADALPVLFEDDINKNLSYRLEQL